MTCDGDLRMLRCDGAFPRRPWNAAAAREGPVEVSGYVVGLFGRFVNEELSVLLSLGIPIPRTSARRAVATVDWRQDEQTAPV